MLLMALTQCLPVRGFRVEILPVNNLERLKSIQFCGTIAIGCEADDFPGWGNQFTFPLVLLDRPLKTRGPELYCVRSDEAQGMELAISHLHEAGCRRIGVIVHGMPDSGNALVRHKAIFDSFRKFGLPEERSLVHYSGFGNDKYMELIAKLLKHRIDALFCPGGSAGIVGMYVLNLLGKHVPDDISFIASEQTFFSQYAVPPQTTITQQYDKLAEAAADIITARIDGRHPPVETILPYTLLDRESVASSNME
jgi:LacI family transcriptional regulator